MKLKYLCLFIWVSVIALAQPRTYTLSLYYNIDQTKPADNYKKLDSVYGSLLKEKYAVTITGYADYLSTEDYNVNLSLRRAEAVKQYLAKKDEGVSFVFNACAGLGEKNSTSSASKEGEPEQRRVDVSFKELFHSKKIGTRENIIQKDSVTKTDPANGARKPSSASTSTKKIEEMKTGESITVEGLNFIPGRHIPVESSVPVLEKLLKTMRENPNLKIEIQGHICCIYETKDGYDYDTHDMNLSANRALTVYNYLVKNGIDKKRLTYHGYGRTQPKIEIEKTPEDEQVNRRVDIKIIEN